MCSFVAAIALYIMLIAIENENLLYEQSKWIPWALSHVANKSTQNCSLNFNREQKTQWGTQRERKESLNLQYYETWWYIRKLLSSIKYKD